jgi:integrase
VPALSPPPPWPPTCTSSRRMSCQSPIPPMSRLGRYKESTIKRYKKAVEDWAVWCDAMGQEPTNRKEVDLCVAEYLQEMFVSNDGKGKGKAAHLVKGLIMLRPEWSKKLYRSWRAVKSWDALVPAVSYPPMSWDVACAVAVVMAARGYERHAVGVLVAHDCLLRVSELCAIKAVNVADVGDARMGSEHHGVVMAVNLADVGDARMGSEHHGVVIKLEKLKGDKVNLTCTVEREDVRRLVRRLLRKTAPSERLFPFTPRTMLNVLKRTCASLGLSKRYVCHSLRHGGATSLIQRDYSVADVMMRGRWETQKMAQRYIQKGEALLLDMTVPRRVAALAAQAAARTYDVVVAACARA